MPPETGSDQQELERLREEVARLDRELMRRAFEVARLREDLNGAMGFERTLSWRVTRPLRSAAEIVRGKLRR